MEKPNARAGRRPWRHANRPNPLPTPELGDGLIFRPETMHSRRSSHSLATRVRKLAQMAAEFRQGKSFNITRLTTVKRLCADPTAAARFAFYLAERTCERMLEDTPPSHLTLERWEGFKQRVATGVRWTQNIIPFKS